MATVVEASAAIAVVGFALEIGELTVAMSFGREAAMGSVPSIGEVMGVNVVRGVGVAETMPLIDETNAREAAMSGYGIAMRVIPMPVPSAPQGIVIPLSNVKVPGALRLHRVGMIGGRALPVVPHVVTGMWFVFMVLGRRRRR